MIWIPKILPLLTLANLRVKAGHLVKTGAGHLATTCNTSPCAGVPAITGGTAIVSGAPALAGLNGSHAFAAQTPTSPAGCCSIGFTVTPFGAIVVFTDGTAFCAEAFGQNSFTWGQQPNNCGGLCTGVGSAGTSVALSIVGGHLVGAISLPQSGGAASGPINISFA